MSDDTSSGELLIANLCAFDPADRGEAIVDLAAFEWFSPVYGGFDHRLASESPADVAMRWRAILSGWGHTSGVQVWPPPLSAVELEHARSCPTLPEPTPNLQAEPASKSHSPVAATVVSVGAVVVALLYALAGIVFLPVGLYLGWRSLGTGFDWKGAATGLFLIVIGAFCVASAYRCCRFAGNARDRLGR